MTIHSAGRFRSSHMTALRILGLAVSSTMVVAVAFGVIQGDFLAEGSEIWGLPWGRVSLVDLYLGLAIFAAWVAFRERSVVVTGAWWLSLLLLGNLAAGIYLTVASLRARDSRSLMLGARAGG